MPAGQNARLKFLHFTLLKTEPVIFLMSNEHEFYMTQNGANAFNFITANFMNAADEDFTKNPIIN